MNWYAIQVMPALCRGAAGYLDGADSANAGATLAETMMEAGCAIRVPLTATGDPMLPGYVLVMPPTDEVAPEQDPLGIFRGDPARWGLQRLKAVPGVVRNDYSVAAHPPDGGSKARHMADDPCLGPRRAWPATGAYQDF